MKSAHDIISIKQIMKEYNCSEKIARLAQTGFQNYLIWQSGNNIKIIEQECELISEKYKFGGCLDAVGIDSENETCILDWKTSDSVFTDHIIQISAYQHLWDFNNPANPITGGFHLCRFSREHADFAHHYWSELDDAWEQFKLFRQAYDLDKKLKKRI